MRIGIDVRLLERKTTGIGRFLMMLLNNFHEIDKKNDYFLFSYAPVTQYREFYTNVPTKSSPLPQKLYSPYWNNFVLPKYLKQMKIDVFISVNQVIPLVKVADCKFISVIHDVIHVKDAAFQPFLFRLYMRIYAKCSITVSHKIVTVSEFSKKDIIAYYPEAKEKIVALHLAADERFRKVEIPEGDIQAFRKKYGIQGPIVLYVGVLENRKNIGTIIKIADQIANVNKDIKFVLAGKPGYGSKRFLGEIHNRANMLHLQGVSDETLTLLYNIASLFLFPSYYEGFGLPPLEAMNAGLPVLASDRTSIPEIVGDAALLHGPDDVSEFTEDIIRLLGDENERNDMRLRGYARAKLFSQKILAERFLAVVKSLGE